MSILFPGDAAAPTYQRLVAEWPIVFARTMSPRLITSILSDRIAADKLDFETDRALARAIVFDHDHGVRR